MLLWNDAFMNKGLYWFFIFIMCFILLAVILAAFELHKKEKAAKNKDKVIK